MRMLIRLIAVLLATAFTGVSLAQSSQRVEIWLASTKSCNSCSLFDQVAKRRGYRDAFNYVHDGNTLRIPIRRIEKDKLPPAIVSQLSGDASPAGRHWSVQLTAIVVQGGKVLHAGSIGESADLSLGRYSEAQMFPPDNPPDDHPAFKAGGEYDRFFLESWNLEYYVAVALGHAKSRAGARLVDLSSKTPISLGRTNVILWGAAETPYKNALFIAQRMREIRSVLEKESSSTPPRFITLYGHGPNVRGPEANANDTSVLKDGSLRFMHADMSADLPANAAGLDSVLTAIKRSEGTRNLLIHVGHSGAAGAPLWGQLGVLQPESLAMASNGKDQQLVMVSGGCHSGLFARSVQCGFFAAHPEVIASGCQRSLSAIDRSDDYLKIFFTGLATRDSDRNDDRDISFSEAHWYAAVRIEDHQLGYTTIDALADEYFKAKPHRLPESLTVSALRNLAKGARPEEISALETLTARLDPDHIVTLKDVVESNHAADRKLRESSEQSSAERNAVLGLPHKLMLPMLARRLLYKAGDSVNGDLQRATACESQSVRKFLQAD